MLDIRTFAVSAVTEWPHDSTSAALNPGKPLALLVYLACSPQRSASREELTDLLWADLEPDAAKHSLRQTAWYIRKRFGEGAISADATSLRLSAEIRFDRDRFLAAVEAGDLAAALTEYEGDFLKHLALPGSAHFESWADIERRRLRAMFVRCAETLSRAALAAGRYKDAQSLARRVLEEDAFNLGAWRILLDSLVASGDVLAAATEADRLEQFLRREEVEADPPTRASLRHARNQDGAHGDGHDGAERPGRLHGLVTDLIGRHREFDQLLLAWEAARLSHAEHVRVVAPAGLGKTRLLRDLYVRLRSMRARVVLVRLNPGGRLMPYAAAADVAAALAALPGASGIDPASAAVLVALNPSLSSTFRVEPDRSEGDEAARRRTIALGELARAVSEEAPFALLIDDVHWSDAASSQILVATAARVRDSRVLLVTAGRPAGQSLGASGARGTLTLEPLLPSQVQEFVSSIAKLPDEPWCDSFAAALHGATFGSPLLLMETLQFALERGALRLDDGTWHCSNARQLEDLVRAGSALERRLGTLSGDETSVLSLLAVAGVPLPLEFVSAAAGRLEGTDAALAELERRGLVRRLGESWLAAHDEIAETLLRSTPVEAVAAAHRGLGREFARRARESETALEFAVQHLRAAHDTSSLRALFHDFVASRRKSGDRAPTRRLAERFLGHEASAEEIAAIEEGVRLRYRVPPRSAVVAAASLPVVALVILAIAFWPREQPEAFVVGSTARGIDAGAIMPALLKDGGSLALHRTLPSGLRALDGKVTLDLPFVELPGRRWAFTAVTPAPDTGGLDVYLLEASGAVRRLTHERSDDAVVSASPDGRLLLVTSGRWSRQEHTSIGILDIASGSMRRFSRGDQAESFGRWSPDGARIAFTRAHYDRHDPEICVAPVDHETENCLTMTGAATAKALAWRDATHLEIAETVDARSNLHLLDVET